MRVLFVHQYLGAFGGAEASIFLTANELQRRGHTLALLYRGRTGRNEDLWHQTFSDCFGLACQTNLERIEAVLEQFRPDVVYLHNLADLEVIEALLASPVPVVRMVHDHALYCMRTYKYNYLTRRICTRSASPYCVFPCLASVGRNREGGFPLRWVSYAQKRKEILLNQRCQRLVVYSEYQKQELIHNGFDAARIVLCTPIRTWNDEGLVSSLNERNLILFVGQIIRGKGVDVLLEALAKVHEPFECLILGDGNHRAFCEQLCSRLGLNGRVQFRGYILPGELKDYYLEASVFVMSSLWPEPFGMAGPEAMRYGVPVVAFDAGGIREWLINGENGYLVPWKDSDIFAARIEDLLRNKELARRLGQQALERVKQYDASHQVNILEQMFLRLIHQARTHSEASSALPPSPLCL